MYSFHKTTTMNTAAKITSTSTRKHFTKVLKVGLRVHPRSVDGVYYGIFVKVVWDGARLSLTGVEGPTKNGDAHGSCGQIRIDATKYDKLPTGWTPELLGELAEIWERWHLNDMRAGCEHQRALWDTQHEVEIVTYSLTREAIREQRSIQARAMLRLRQGETVTLTAEESAHLSLPYETHQAPDADGPGSGCYKVSHRETRKVSQIFPTQHPAGVLCKPCDVCSYKYGSQWLHEDVPDDVLDFLCSLPESDTEPCWI